MKYTKALIDVIELEAEDVVLTSSENDCPDDDTPDCPRELLP